MNYNWDIVKWIKLVLGSLWATNRALLIKCLLAPILRMYNDPLYPTATDNFIALMDDINNRTRYNSSTKALTALLNKLFDPILNGIYIETVSDDTTIYYQPLSAETPVGYDRMTQVNIADGITTGIYYEINIAEFVTIVDFIVYVPASLTAQQPNITAWVNYYRFASLTFKIILI